MFDLLNAEDNIGDGTGGTIEARNRCKRGVDQHGFQIANCF